MKKETLERFKSLSLEIANTEQMGRTECLTLALRINRLLEDEIKADTMDMTVKSGKLDLFKFVSRDKERTSLCGVYFKDGYAVACDTVVMVKDERPYDPEWEGKSIGRDGKVIADRYPAIDAVIEGMRKDCTTHLGVLDYKTFKEASDVCKTMGKTRIHIESREGGLVLCLSSRHVKPLLAYLKAKCSMDMYGKMFKANRILNVYVRNDSTEFFFVGSVKNYPADDPTIHNIKLI